jgi:hypothetical protein
MARRKADPVFGARVARVLTVRFGSGKRRPIDREKVLARIREGAIIKAWPPEREMPRKDILDRFRREDRGFNAAVREAIVEARRRRSNRRKLSKLGRNAAWITAQKAVPASLQSDIRDDVVGELSLLLCSGEVAVDGDLTAAWRRCRTRLTGHRWKETSLDAPLNGTDGLRRVDLLDSEVVRA